MRQSVILCIALLATSCQPKDVRPGTWIRGEPVEIHIADWAFTNDIEEIFIETRPWYLVPHSTTIWCVELDGRLYVGSYGDDRKFWEKNIARNPDAKIAVSSRTYEVRATKVVDPEVAASLDTRYPQKYDMADVFGDEIPAWRYYHLAQPRD